MPVQEAPVLPVCEKPGFLFDGQDGTFVRGSQGVCSKEAISYGRGGEGEEGGRGLLCCTCEWEEKVAWTLDVNF